MIDYSQTPVSAIALDLGPTAKVSTHFSLYELMRSETASRLGIDNRFPDLDTLRAAVHLCRAVLEPIRTAHGPFTPNSVFRCQALERALKNQAASWKSSSKHAIGCACDVEVPGLATLELAHWAETNLPDFDQIICECYNPAEGPNSGWVHIALLPPGKGANRRELRSYIKNPATGKFAYVEGLRESVV